MTPISTIILGVVFLAVAGAVFYFVFDGFHSGEILKISKFNPRYVSRHDDSGLFWSVVAGYFVIGVFNTTVALWFFISAFKKSR